MLFPAVLFPGVHFAPEPTYQTGIRNVCFLCFFLLFLSPDTILHWPLSRVMLKLKFSIPYVKRGLSCHVAS